MATPIQKQRASVQLAVWEALKDLPNGAKRGKMVRTLAKRYKLATVTINKYFRYEVDRQQALADAEATKEDIILGQEYESPKEESIGSKEASEWIKTIGGFNYNLPNEASFVIEQMTANEITIHLTLTVPTTRFAEVILGLLEPQPMPYA